MTIKSKISLFVSIFFSVLFGLIALFIISSFSEFRKDEFKERLKEEALTTIKLLVEVKEVDEDILKIIDQNTINQLYNEKTLIFNKHHTLIYSSLDNMKIQWSTTDFEFLKKNKEFFKRSGDYEIYGIYYDSNQDDYFALVSANDNYGKRKLNYLIYLIVGAYVIFLIITWVFTFFMIKQQLKPLDFLLHKIKHINDLNSLQPIDTQQNSLNEIDLIGQEFNFMMNRITDIYNKQKEFTAHVSHELRTPLLRMSAQIENRLRICNEPEKIYYNNMLFDIKQVNELLHGLLLLTRQEVQAVPENETIRIDEVLYNAIERIVKDIPDIVVDFDIPLIPTDETIFTIHANAVLLETAFVNLLKNAYLYSHNQRVIVNLLVKHQKPSLVFQNNGPLIPEQEQSRLFQPFMRGENAQKQKGLGLGLAIVQRILNSAHIHIQYSHENDLNTFILFF